MSNDDQSRKYFGGFLDESVHKAMVDVCSMIGKRPIDFAELCVIAGIKAEYQKARVQGKEVSASILLAVRQQELAERRSHRMIVQQMALDCLEAPTEQALEELAEACLAIGSTVEEEMERARNSAHVLKLMEDNGGKLNQAQMWLAQHMQPNQPYDSRTLFDQALANGFSEATINRAKDKMPIRSEVTVSRGSSVSASGGLV